MTQAKPPPERVPLAQFLSRLDEASAAEARAAAAKIDELARAGDGLEGIERLFMIPAGIAALAFVAGIWFFFSPGTAPPAVTVACLAALPLILVFYGFRVLSRTRADREAEDLNRRYFLPHGGIYFAAGANPACVIQVAAQSAKDRVDPEITSKDLWR